MKSFTKLEDKYKKQSSGSVLLKDVLKILQDLQNKIFAEVPFLIEVQAGKLKLSETAAGDVLQKKMFLKILQILQENTCVRVSF